MSWKIAWRNLKRNARRSFSTGLAVCVGFVALNLLSAYIYRTYQTLLSMAVYMNQYGHLQVRKQGSIENFESKPKRYLINKSEVQEIEKQLLSPIQDKIEFTGKLLSASGLLSNGLKSHPIYATGFDNKSYVRAIKHPNMQEHGKFFLLPWQREKIDLFASNPELIAVTPLISRIMGFKEPLESNESVQLASLNLDGDLNAVNADLGAIHSTGAEFLEGTVILVPIAKIQDLLGTDGIETFTIFLKNYTDIDAIQKYLEMTKDKLSFPVEIFRFSDSRINNFFEGSMGFLYVLGGFFLGLICVAVSLTIINSLTMGIIERTREIGALRAIGFKKHEVKNIFTKESVLIAVIAIFVGTILSSIIARLVNNSNIMFSPPGTPNSIQFTLLWNIQIAFGVSILLIFVSWLSAEVVVRRKLNNKLIHLLNDIGETEK